MNYTVLFFPSTICIIAFFINSKHSNKDHIAYLDNYVYQGTRATAQSQECNAICFEVPPRKKSIYRNSVQAFHGGCVS